MQTIKKKIRNKINIEIIKKIPNNYPEKFIKFCKENRLTPPRINTKNGMALYAMLVTPEYYWDRESSNKFVEKFTIETNDSIQLFNKHEQWGIKTSKERGKNYIITPYELSNKHKMRKNFMFDGTEKEKNNEIEKIKSTIKNDYIEIPNSEWQLGHKNPESIDNTKGNLVLQPPIQSKYRDKYIFIDTLTKIPTPTTLKKLYENGNSPYTKDQLKQLKDFINTIKL